MGRLPESCKAVGQIDRQDLQFRLSDRLLQLDAVGPRSVLWGGIVPGWNQPLLGEAGGRQEARAEEASGVCNP